MKKARRFSRGHRYFGGVFDDPFKRHYGTEFLAYAAIAATVLSTAVTVYAGAQQASQQAKIAKQQAKIAQEAGERDAQIREQQAGFDERQTRRKLAFLQGQQTADFAAAGLETTSGSPLLHEIDFAKQSELEALSIKWAGRVGADSSRYAGMAQSTIARATARAYQSGIPLQIAGGLIGGVGRVASIYERSRQGRRSSVLSDWAEADF